VSTIDMGRKEGGGLLCPFREEPGPRLIQCGLGRGLLPHQVASSSIQPFGHNTHGPKIGWGGCAFFSGDSWVLIEHKVAWAEAYLRTKWHLDACSRLATIDVRRKLGAPPLFGERAGCPSNTMWPGPRPTGMPSFILIHQTVAQK